MLKEKLIQLIVRCEMRELKVGLALGAGAARGLAHIGVLQVFQEKQIPVHMIAGTSIGSIIGAFYASGVDLYMLGKLSEHLQWKHLTDFTICKTGLINGNEILSFIRLLTQNKKFSELNLPFAVMATDICNGEEVILKEGIVADAVRASISVPGVFTPVELSGRLLVDGAVTSRLPVRAVKELGADLVIGVDVAAEPTINKNSNIIDIILQTISIMDSEIAKLKATEAEIIVKPSIGNVAGTAIHRAGECIEIGRQAALAALPQIQQLLTEKSQF